MNTTLRYTRLFAAMLLLAPALSWAGGTVNNCTEAELRAAMAGGGTVAFACDGTITLATTITNDADTLFDATGHQVTISGGNSVRVFYIPTNFTFTVANLTIANGSSVKGAGIFNDGGRVNLTGVTLVGNQAVGIQKPGSQPSEGAEGGAVFNAGVLTATSCVFLNNSSIQPSWWPNGTGPPVYNPVMQAFGGAIRNVGTVTLQSCQFTGNAARGEDGYWSWTSPWPVAQLGLDGYGGAIHNAGRLSILSCSFVQNTARGGAGAQNTGQTLSSPIPPGGAGGSAAGGATYSSGSLSITNSVIVSNTVTAGYGGGGQTGVGSPPFFDPRGPGGPGGPGGSANGGAVFLSQGTLSAVNTTFSRNTSAGGRGGRGGRGVDAYYNNTSGTDGGAGGNGGSASGAIAGAADLNSCTLAFDSATYGAGGSGGAGGAGRGIGSQGATGANGADGAVGGGGLNGGSCINTLLATNAPGNNGSSPITDRGHNLSSDNTCLFSAPGSLNNIDPKLGPLADNGGSTPTMALLPGSPAIDAGDTAAAPPTDQRGFPRPYGAAADIGAYEYGSMLPVLSIAQTGATDLDLLVQGNPNQPCRLFTSQDFSVWTPVATTNIGLDGTVSFRVDCNSSEACRFYRVSMP